MNFISSILQDLLSTLFSFTGDLGVAIVVVTLMVKLILMPLSMKQKFSMRKQQDMANKMNQLKEKYKNNPKELEKQMQLHATESVKSMLGCSTLLLQMPIVFALYRTFSSMPQDFSSSIVPWINNLSMSDNLFIIPCIYTLIMLAPSLISYIPYFKTSSQVALNKHMAIMTVVMSFILTARTPVALGLYFITSGVYALIEDICFRIYFKSKNKLALE